MNKKQLVAKISSTLGQSKADAERTFDSITTIILDALKNDDTVKIAGFGTYKVYFISTKSSYFYSIIILQSI